jgi:hypothetical protein
MIPIPFTLVYVGNGALSGRPDISWGARRQKTALKQGANKHPVIKVLKCSPDRDSGNFPIDSQIPSGNV